MEDRLFGGDEVVILFVKGKNIENLLKYDMNEIKNENKGDRSLADYMQLLAANDWQTLYRDAADCLDGQQRGDFEGLAPMDAVVSFVVIVLWRFIDDFSIIIDAKNAIVAAAASIALENMPLFECRNRAKVLVRMVAQQLQLETK